MKNIIQNVDMLSLMVSGEVDLWTILTSYVAVIVYIGILLLTIVILVVLIVRDNKKDFIEDAVSNNLASSEKGTLETEESRIYMLTQVDKEKAEAVFCTCADKPVAVYEYCNLHGLWKTEL